MRNDQVPHVEVDRLRAVAEAGARIDTIRREAGYVLEFYGSGAELGEGKCGQNKK
jgi:hypothetical protein